MRPLGKAGHGVAKKERPEGGERPHKTGRWWILRRGYSTAIEEHATRPQLERREGEAVPSVTGPYETQEAALRVRNRGRGKIAESLDTGEVY